MKNTWNKATAVLLAAPLLLVACSKNDHGQLDGPAPVASFTTSTPKTVGLTSVVTFTSTSTDAFLYEWDFGDGTTGTGSTVTHTYQSGGTVKAQLIVSGRGGTGVSAVQNITLPDVTTIVKQLLTNGSSKTWKVDNSVAAAITVGPSDSDVTGYYAGGTAGSLPACQADDEYTFSNANVFTYDAKTETYVAANSTTNTPAKCDTPRSGTANYTFGAASGSGIAQITLGTPNSGGFRSAIGVTDAPDQVYRIVSIDATHMVLKAGAATASPVFQLKLIAK